MNKSSSKRLGDSYAPFLLAILMLFGFFGYGQTYHPGLHVVTNDAISPAQATPVDSRSQFYDSVHFVYRDYNGTAEVLSYLNLGKYRFGHSPIFVHVGGTLSAGVWTGGIAQIWWFKNGTADSNLVRWYSDSTGGACAGCLLAANNLSDVANAATSRTNLGLGNVDNTSDVTKWAATATLTNKSMSGLTNTFSNIQNSALSNSSIGLTVGTTGSDINVSVSPAPLGTSIGLNIPTAGTGTRGALSAANWNYFNAKVDSIHVSNDSLFDFTGGVGTFRGAFPGASSVISVSNTDATLTISPITGNVVASLNLGHANTWSNTQTFSGVVLAGQTSFSANNTYSIGSVTQAAAHVWSRIFNSDASATLSSTVGNAASLAIGPTSGITLLSTGQAQFNNYTTSSSFTGTPLAFLQTDASGNIIQTPVGNIQVLLGNEGVGYRLFDPVTNKIKTLTCSGCTLDSATAGQIGITVTGGGSGTVTTVSVVTANGFAGSVANPTTTPAITISTSVNGLAFGNGTSLAAATVSSPLTYSAGTLAIQVANTSQNGYLSSTDWNTFNGKQGAITLTTTGTTGAATFITNTLNIPQYQGQITLTTTGTSGASTLVGNTLNIPQYSSGGGGGSPVGPSKSVQIKSATTGSFGDVPNFIADSTTATVFMDSAVVHKLKADSIQLSHSIWATPDLLYWLDNSYGTASNRPDGTNGIYPSRIATILGLSLTNASAAGTGIWQQVSSFNGQSVPTSHFTGLSGWLNDFRYTGAGNNPLTYNKQNSGVMAVYCRQFAKTAVAASSSGSGVTRFGTWTTKAYNNGTYGGGASGSYTITQNDSIVWSFTDSSAYIMLMGGVSNYATYNVFLDTVLVKQASSSNRTDGVQVLGHNDNFIDYPLIFMGLRLGPHTVKIVKTSAAADTLGVDYVGTMQDISTATPLLIWEQPYENVAGYAVSPANSNITIAQTSNAVLDSMFYTLYSKYPAYLMPTNTRWDTLSCISSDHLHPNNYGDSMYTAVFQDIVPYHTAGYYKALFQIGRKRLDANFDGRNRSVAWWDETSSKADILNLRFRSGLATGSAGFLPVFNSATTLVNSVVFQSGTSIGVNNSSPVDVFDITTTNNSIRLKNATSATGIGIFGGSSAFWNNRDYATGLVNNAGSPASQLELNAGKVNVWVSATNGSVGSTMWTFFGDGHLVGGIASPTENNVIFGANQVLQAIGGATIDGRLSNRQNTYLLAIAGDGQTVFADSTNLYHYVAQVNKTGAREFQLAWENGSHSFTRGTGLKLDTLNNFFFSKPGTGTSVMPIVVWNTATGQVDTVTASSLGATYTFNNGLTNTSGTVGLGGTLSSNTTLTMANNNLTFTGGNVVLTGNYTSASNSPAYLNLTTGNTVTVPGTGTNSDGGLIFFNGQTIAASSAITFTNASTLLLSGAPTAGTNVTITNAYALRVSSGDSYFNGNITGVGGQVILGSSSGTRNWNPNAAIPGAIFNIQTGTLNDNVTSTSGTVTNAIVAGISTPTLTATNTGVTVTNAYNLFVNGPPVAGTNVTITNAYSFGVNGAAIFQSQLNTGSIAFNGWQTVTSGSSATVNNVQTNFLVNPSSLIATFTITLPSAPDDGQLVKLHFGGTLASGVTVVTSLTISPNSGQSIEQTAAPATAVGGDCFMYQFNKANSAWYREK